MDAMSLPAEALAILGIGGVTATVLLVEHALRHRARTRWDRVFRRADPDKTPRSPCALFERGGVSYWRDEHGKEHRLGPSQRYSPNDSSPDDFP